MTDYNIQKAFDLSLDMICIADNDCFLKRVNPSFQRVLGWTPEELMSQPFTNFIHPDDLSATLQEHDKASRGKPVINFENRYRCKDGTYRYLMWTSYPEIETGLLYAVARDITEKKLSEEKTALITRKLEGEYEKLEKLATTDPLTGLFNRRVFDAQLLAQINLMNRMSKSLSVLMVDVDHFKQHNDKYGHIAGDAALKAISTQILENLRTTDIVTRYGGEELAIILPDTSKEISIQLAEKLCKAIHDYGVQDKRKLTVSIGASSVSFENTASLNISEIKSQIVLEADHALYYSKNNGRNLVSHYLDYIDCDLTMKNLA